MSQLEFKSPRDGSLLSFAITERSEESIEFSVQVKTPNFSGGTFIDVHGRATRCMVSKHG